MNRKKHLKFLSLAAALCLILALLPSVSLAAENRTLYYSSIDAKLHYGSEKGPVADDLTGWSGNGNTLTLTDFSYATAADCALYINGTLELVGDNKLECTATSNSSVVHATLMSYSSLTITGTGSLELKSGDDASDTFNECCIFALHDLSFSGSVRVTAYAHGTQGVRIISAENLYLYDDPTLTLNGKRDAAGGSSGGTAVSRSIAVKTLTMEGGTIYSFCEDGKAGGGIWLTGDFLSMSGGAIYSSCVGESSAQPVLFSGALPPGLIVSGSYDAGFDDSGYTVKGAFTNLYINNAVSKDFRAVLADEQGDPDFSAKLMNFKITPPVSPGSYYLVVNYLDEDGNAVSSETINNLPGGSVVTGDKLSIPAGYDLKEPFSVKISAYTGVNVVVISDVKYTLTVNFLDEDGKPLGTQEIKAPENSVLSGGDFSVPGGYELRDEYSVTLTEDMTISVTVYKKDKSFNASDWAQQELEEADKFGLIPDSLRDEDLTKPITRAEFAAVAVKVYEALAGVAALPSIINPFTDTKDIEVLKAYNVGITNGTSATEFSPDLLLSREQAATMLTRVFKRVTMPGWTLAGDGAFPLSYTMPNAFADDADISDYARDSVYFLTAFNVINGIGGNLFAPKNTTTEQEAEYYANATREQAILIALRMTENL